MIPLRRRLKASSMLEASPTSGALVGEADEVADEPTWFQATTVAETTVPFSRPPTVQLGAMLGLGRNSQVPRTAPRSLFTVATYRSIGMPPSLAEAVHRTSTAPSLALSCTSVGTSGAKVKATGAGASPSGPALPASEVAVTPTL